jgi:hypothetical protein
MQVFDNFDVKWIMNLKYNNDLWKHKSQQRKLVVKNVNACFMFPKMDVDEHDYSKMQKERSSRVTC